VHELLDVDARRARARTLVADREPNLFYLPVGPGDERTRWRRHISAAHCRQELVEEQAPVLCAVEAPQQHAPFVCQLRGRLL
jgi:hypothetical protein